MAVVPVQVRNIRRISSPTIDLTALLTAMPAIKPEGMRRMKRNIRKQFFPDLTDVHAAKFTKLWGFSHDMGGERKKENMSKQYCRTAMRPYVNTPTIFRRKTAINIALTRAASG